MANLDNFNSTSQLRLVDSELPMMSGFTILDYVHSICVTWTSRREYFYHREGPTIMMRFVHKGPMI